LFPSETKNKDKEVYTQSKVVLYFSVRFGSSASSLTSLLNVQKNQFLKIFFKNHFFSGIAGKKHTSRG
jgi:hypothetical protein